MTTFEMGLLLGTVSGVVIGLCIAVILVKLETRRDRRPGYINDPVRQFRAEIAEMRRKQDPKTKLGTRRSW